METTGFKPNQNIYIEMDMNNSKEYIPSRIEEIDEHFLYIAMPMRQGNLIPIRPGEKILVRMYRKTTFYGFQTIVAGRKLEPIPMLLVARPEKVYPVAQRRRHVRIKVVIPATLTIAPELTLTTNTVDISAGGVSFSVVSAGNLVKAGQQVETVLMLPNYGSVYSRGRVIRVFNEIVQDGPGGRIAVQYESIEEKDRDRIARFIFQKQREYIQKGLRD